MTDDVECIEPLSLDLRRHQLDTNARPIVAWAAPLRYLAGVLGDDARLFLLSRRRRRLIAAAQHQAENCQRQLRVVLRQLFRLLA
jgi:hypothetical protein